MRQAWLIGALGLAVLAGCEERERILPGQRESLRAIFDDAAAAEPTETANESRPISLPSASNAAAWESMAGAPARTPHLALAAAPQLAFAANIGQGDSRKSRITANPVVADGRVYTLDSSSKVTATSTGGATLWSADLPPSRDKASEATGGGLGFGGGKVFVSTGFGLLTALDPATGGILWQQELEGTGSGTPVHAGGIVYVMAGDDTAWAVDASNGRVRWQLSGTPDVANILGAPAPAISGDLAIFAFGDGEVQGAFAKGGLARWGTQLAGQRRFEAGSKVSDITGDPVVAGGSLYVGSAMGRLVAMDPASGERLWTAQEGTTGPVWPVSGAVFAVSERGELLRLDAGDGAIVWRTALPGFTKDRPKKQIERFVHHGPIIAGGRVVVASSDGSLRFFDPASGAQVYEVTIPGGATTAPVVAGGTLYVVSKRGQLLAFR